MGKNKMSCSYRASGNGRDTFIARTDQVLRGRGDYGTRPAETLSYTKYTGYSSKNNETPRGQRATGVCARDSKVVANEQLTTAAAYGDFYVKGVPKVQPSLDPENRNEKAFDVPSRPIVPITPRQVS